MKNGADIQAKRRISVCMTPLMPNLNDTKRTSECFRLEQICSHYHSQIGRIRRSLCAHVCTQAIIVRRGNVVVE